MEQASEERGKFRQLIVRGYVESRGGGFILAIKNNKKKGKFGSTKRSLSESSMKKRTNGSCSVRCL